MRGGTKKSVVAFDFGYYYKRNTGHVPKKNETIIRAYNGMSQCGGPEAAQNEQKEKDNR